MLPWVVNFHPEHRRRDRSQSRQTQLFLPVPSTPLFASPPVSPLSPIPYRHTYATATSHLLAINRYAFFSSRRGVYTLSSQKEQLMTIQVHHRLKSSTRRGTIHLSRPGRDRAPRCQPTSPPMCPAQITDAETVRNLWNARNTEISFSVATHLRFPRASAISFFHSSAFDSRAFLSERP
jgi:hypothetical protein